MFDPATILVLAPHTDDGELGCGGTIAKFASEGKQVHYAAFSLCSKSLPEGLPPDTLARECRTATSVLGLPDSQVTLFDFEVRNFPKFRQDILEELVTLSRKIQPSLVLVPAAADIHQDHGVVHIEAIRAFRKSSVIGYELPWNLSRFNAGFFVELSGKYIDKKAEALKAYRSQGHRNYMQGDFVTSLAKVRGIQCGSEYAEAFEVYKMIAGR